MHTLNILHRLFYSISSMRMVVGFVLVSWNSMKFIEFLWPRDTNSGHSQGPLVWDFVENPIISWDTFKQMRRDTWEFCLLWLLNKKTVMHCFIPFLFKFVKWLRADTCLHRSDRIASAKSCLPAAGWIFACFVTFQCDRTQAQHTSASKYTNTGTQTHEIKHTITSSCTQGAQAQISERLITFLLAACAFC